MLAVGSQCELRPFGGVPGSSHRVMCPLRLRWTTARSECAHRTVFGLQGPRVNLTCRWVTQHAASCPLAGVVGCVVLVLAGISFWVVLTRLLLPLPAMSLIGGFLHFFSIC